MVCTGYTSQLVEKGQDFESFVMGCARAMGACVTMRDDPMDTPIPEKFEPDSYCAKALKAAQQELKRFEGMNENEKLTFGEAAKKREIETYEKLLADDKVVNTRVDAMVAKVNAWQPPTPDHKGLKKLMLEQLGVSIQDTNYTLEHIKTIKNRTTLEYYTDAVENKRRDVVYYSEQDKEEHDRAVGRTEWIQQLRDSLKAKP